MSATKDFVALDWIKGDISQTLDQAQEALEAIAESAEDTSSMRACLTALHQVHGTLRMLEIEGPTRLSGEMEELAQALMSNEVPDVPQAQEVLMQAMLQMPGYLDRIQREQRDTPEAVRGIINNMRLARGEAKLDGGAEDLVEDTIIEALAKPPTSEVIAAFKSRKGAANAKKLRKRFQQALIGVIKNADTRGNLRQMGQTFTMLIRACGESPKSALFEMALAFLEGIGAGAIKLDAAANSILKALDQEIRSLSDAGEAALAAPVSQSLGADILAAINGAKRDTPRIISARDKFKPVAISKVDSIAIGPDDETLSTVGRILMEELASITDKLDLYVRSDKTDVKALEALIPQLEQIRSTMAVVGLGDHQDNITRQIETIKSLSANGEIPDEALLLDIAGAFLKVESALRAIVGDVEEGEDSLGSLSDAEIAVIKETRNSLALCKDSILDYIASDFDKSKLLGMPELLKALGGGLVIINQGRIADVLVACAAFLQANVQRSGQYPQIADMDDVADAITSVDYFFERYIVNPKEPYRQMLDVAEEAMSKLGFPPGQPYDVQSVDVGLGDEESTGEAEELTADELELEAVDSSTEDTSPSASVEGKDVLDNEIIEIFAEEAREVLETLDEFFPVWQADPTEKEPLTEVRRAFHTLKGSGRMVGAVEVGELAWSVENMLNRVLDESIEIVPEIFDVVSEAISCLPDGIAKFRAGEQETFDCAAIAARAAALAGGEDGNLGIATVEDVEFDESLFGEEPGSIESTGDSGGESLDDVFLADARRHVDTIREYVANPGRATPALVAAFHTLKGSAGMAKVPAVARVAGPLESLAAAQADRGGSRNTLVELSRDGLALIEAVMGNLAANRDGLPGLDEFCESAESALSGSAKGANRFDFENIRLLARVDPVLSAWDAAEVSVVMSELREAVRQAQILGQGDVVDLAEALLGVYERLGTERPGEDVMRVLTIGHEQLVLMFDHLASSQRVIPAPDVVKELREFASPAQPQAYPTVDSKDGATELPADELDEEVLPLFLEEAEELEEAIDQSILAWSNEPEDLTYLDGLLRQLHTLKGGARLAGLNSLGEFAHNFETFLINVQKNPVEMDEAFFGLLNDQQDEISRRIAIYTKISLNQASAEEIESMRYVGSDAMPRVEAVPDEVVEAEVRATAQPGPATIIDLPEDELDMDVLPVFLEEAEELLEGIDQNILDWSKIPSATEPLDNLLRQLHTLKGGARVAGMASLGEYTHNFETFLSNLSKDAVALDDAFFELVNRHQDEINRRLGIYKKMALGEATEDELISMRTAVEPGDALVATQQDVTVDAEPDAGKAQAAGAGASQSAPSEVVRVSSELLENLISLAGESSITRGRVQQQIGDFGEALEEMEETIERIREHVRRLEIEAESRETVLRSRKRDDDSGFDELEMDRYTMLQEISRALSEATSDVSDLKDTLVNKSRDSETLLHQQSRISTELQEGLTRTRMVPFARLIPRLRRIVRQISAEIGKSVRFDAYNVEGELDRTVLERIVAPLEHMLRNAVDHGIEPALDRRAAGKPEQGRISLRLSREGAYVVLTISDDGAGINLEAVRKKAIERGLMKEDSNLSDQEIRQFIMHAGFSTAQKLTQISGRGVGLDVVASEIKQLGGTVSIDSTEGVGTEFTIQLPFTVSINRALMVVVQDETYAIPLNTIEGIYRVSPYELEAYYQPDAPMFEAAGQPYHLVYMGRLLNKAPNPNLEGQVVPLPVILARSGDHAVAFQVDKVIGSREVIVKSLGPQFNEVAGVSGATVMGDGSVVVILDVMALVRGAEARVETEEAVPEPVPEDKGTRTVMIVDDSVTVRKVTSRLMERQGWDVVTAKDGIEAMSHLQEMYPDIMLLDIEMPRMDGFEVLRAVRRDERLKDLPIIMITSRTGEKHKQQALELGVNRFLGKPFQEANLLSNIEEVISSGKVH